MPDVIGGTALAATKEDAVASFLQAKLRQSALLLPTVTDYSSLAVPGAKSVSIIKQSGEFVVNKLPTPNDDNTACPLPQAINFGADKIDFDCRAHVGWQIDDFCDVQSKISATAQALESAAYAHAADIDKCIYADLFDGAAVANDVTDSGDIITNIACAEQKLREQNVPYQMGDIFYVMTPEAKKNLLVAGSLKIIDTSVYGGQMPLIQGEIGMLLGARLIVTNHANPLFNDKIVGAPVTGQMMYHRRALGFALQAGPQMKSVEDPNCFTTAYGLAQMYGKKVMCDGNYAAKIVV